jgi:electron transfer flavoprotein alpha subunit
MNKVCIFIDQKDGVPTSNSQKVLYMAQALKRQYGHKIIAIIMEQKCESFIEYLKTIEVDQIYYVTLINKNKLLFLKNEIDNLVCFLKEINPDVVWATNGSCYRILFPKIAYSLHTGLCAACSDFKHDENSGRINMVRSVFSNNAYAQISVHRSRPVMATILDEKGTYNLERNLTYPDIHDITERILLIQDNQAITTMKELESICLDKAQIVIGLGNGIHDKSDIDLFEKLSKLLNHSAIGGTRELINRQILPQNCQIGSTGTQIFADIYIGFGISGSPQHIQGIEHVKKIIAVNNDPYASIFQHADYGVVGDMYEVAKYMINYLGGKDT